MGTPCGPPRRARLTRDVARATPMIRPRGSDLLLLTVVALVTRLVAAIPVGYPPYTDPAYYGMVGEQLADRPWLQRPGPVVASWRSAGSCPPTLCCRCRATGTGCRSPRSWPPARSPSSAISRTAARRRDRRSSLIGVALVPFTYWLGDGPVRLATSSVSWVATLLVLPPGRCWSWHPPSTTSPSSAPRGRRDLVPRSRATRAIEARPLAGRRRRLRRPRHARPGRRAPLAVAPAIAWAGRGDWRSVARGEPGRRWARRRSAGRVARGGRPGPVAVARPRHLRHRPSRPRAATPSGSPATTSSSRSAQTQPWPRTSTGDWSTSSVPSSRPGGRSAGGRSCSWAGSSGSSSRRAVAGAAPGGELRPSSSTGS